MKTTLTIFSLLSVAVTGAFANSGSNEVIRLPAVTVEAPQRYVAERAVDESLHELRDSLSAPKFMRAELPILKPDISAGDTRPSTIVTKESITLRIAVKA